MSDELSAAQRQRIRRLSVPAATEGGAEGGELNVVPYLDIIMNIMMFVLVTVSVAFTTTIQTASAGGPRQPTAAPSLHLTALVTSEGVALKTSGGAVAPGCEAMGGGLTVPKQHGEYDLVGLTACARRIKNASPAPETQVTLTASPNVPYDAVVGVMDALRRDPEGELFPDVSLGVAR